MFLKKSPLKNLLKTCQFFGRHKNQISLSKVVSNTECQKMSKISFNSSLNKTLFNVLSTDDNACGWMYIAPNSSKKKYLSLLSAKFSFVGSMLFDSHKKCSRDDLINTLLGKIKNAKVENESIQEVFVTILPRLRDSLKNKLVLSQKFFFCYLSCDFWSGLPAIAWSILNHCKYISLGQGMNF